VFELHELEVAGNQVEISEISRPDDLAEIAAVAVVADRAVEGFVFADVEFRLQAVEGGETRLGIKIECEDAVATAAVVVLPLPPLKFTTVMTWRCSLLARCGR
jgi:hypothetical protein